MDAGCNGPIGRWLANDWVKPASLAATANANRSGRVGPARGRVGGETLVENFYQVEFSEGLTVRTIRVRGGYGSPIGPLDIAAKMT